MYKHVKLPTGGYAGEHYRITNLELAIGQRADTHTELYVRGIVLANGGHHPFAGSTILRDGRDTPEHDITCPNSYVDCDLLCIDAHMALDQYAEELMAAEMKRICG